MTGNARNGWLIAVMVLILPAATAQAVMIDMVPVGNLGNTADTTGYGAVDYAYNIGKYEVTAGQYTEFLNAKAANGPPRALQHGDVGGQSRRQDRAYRLIRVLQLLGGPRLGKPAGQLR